MAEKTPTPAKPSAYDGPGPASDHERGDWFFDELMTPQPDAAQEYFRARLKALAEETRDAAKDAKS